MFSLPFSCGLNPQMVGSLPGTSFPLLLLQIPEYWVSDYRLSTIISVVTFIVVKWAYGLFFPPLFYPWSEIRLLVNQLGFPDTLLWASFVALWCLAGHVFRGMGACPFRTHCVCKGCVTSFVKIKRPGLFWEPLLGLFDFGEIILKFHACLVCKIDVA